jgi:glycerate dehydrogenase
VNINRAAFLDLASVHRNELDLSGLELAVPEWMWFDNIDENEIPHVLANVDVVVTNKVVLAEKQLKQADHLKLICIAATGTNNVDLLTAKSLDIPVCNVRGYATASVVQHVFSMLLSLTTQLERYQKAVQQGQWSRSEHFCLLDFPIRELQGKILGIVGYGELGQAVSKVAESFGMKVLISKRNDGDSNTERLPLHELIQQADVLSLHCPLNEQTRNLIGRHELSLMKNDAVLINTARGGLVDENALVEALVNNRIGGAAIDVLDKEPPEDDHPLLRKDIPNLILTPHIAWASIESRQRLIDEVAKNIEAFKTGKLLNRVITVT